MNAELAAKPPRSVGEIDSFVSMLLAACESRKVNDHLEELLALPDQKRQATVHAWVNDLLIAQAPPDFIQAIACLMDDRVAEKAYEVIYQCQRPSKPVELPDTGGIMQVLRALVEFPSEPIMRFIRGLVPMLPAAFIVTIGMWSLPTARELVELPPAACVRARSVAIKAYEDMWWAAVRKKVDALCRDFLTQGIGYYFGMRVNAEGGIVSVDTRPYYSSELTQALRDLALPAFSPAEIGYRTLYLRGYFLREGNKCYLQRT